MQLNKAVAALYELVTASDKAAPSPYRSTAIRNLIVLVAPMAPHLAEEAWSVLGGEGMVVDQPWPAHDPALLVDEEVTIAVQVNGKLRHTLSAPRGMAREDLQAMALGAEKVAALLGDAAPKKVIVVPDRLVNIVL